MKLTNLMMLNAAANIAIGIKVGAGLVAVFLALGASRFVMKD